MSPWSRIGYHADPLGFRDLKDYAWQHRFDDADRRFRTIYCARDHRTSFREVLADYRPNASLLAELKRRVNADTYANLRYGRVGWDWRTSNVLCDVRYRLGNGELREFEDPSRVGEDLADLTDPEITKELTGELAETLADHGIEHLDLHQITTEQRPVTQAISAYLYERGWAGLYFTSKLQGGRCAVLFEDRADLVLAAGTTPVPLTDDVAELLEVCTAWDLHLATGPSPLQPRS